MLRRKQPASAMVPSERLGATTDEEQDEEEGNWNTQRP